MLFTSLLSREPSLLCAFKVEKRTSRSFVQSEERGRDTSRSLDTVTGRKRRSMDVCVRVRREKKEEEANGSKAKAREGKLNSIRRDTRGTKLKRLV